MLEGLVLWGVKSIYYVQEKFNKKIYKCQLKGKIIDTDFNLKNRRESNPIVVGDKVEFEKVDDENGMIVNRKKRFNEFKRLKRGGRVVQTIFANVDCLIVVDSIANPPLRPYFIDRCLFTAEYMNIPSVIVFNKIDLLNDKNQELYTKIKKVYNKLGYKTLDTSVSVAKGIEELKDILYDKLCSFNGRSGVGKSSLIKKLDPDYNDIKIGQISSKFDRGRHTTTFSKIYPMSFGGSIIDTPGIRELAIFVDKCEDVEKYMLDFDNFRDKCKYQNCQHINEPDCNVLKALKNGEIEEFRYETYLRMRSTVEKLKDSKI